MTRNEILAVTNFLGDNITIEQADQLMDEARQLSMADIEWLYNNVEGGPLYTDLSMTMGEMGL